MKADLLSPTPGEADISSDATFSWTEVDGASAYFLYIGSTQGAQDLVSTGEIQTTVRHVTGLPGGSYIYVRLWTKAGDIWRYNDYTFRTADRAVLLAPAQDGSPLPLDVQFEWTSVGGAEAYYLYIGSTPGDKDIVDSYSMQSTAFSVSGLPEGEMIHVRLWTKFGEVWRYVDYEFNVVALRARLIAPAAGSTNVEPRATFSWTSIPGSQAYYLYVGTAPGLKDVVDSSSTQATTYVGPLLEGNTRYFIRLWTLRDGIWRYIDYDFTTAPISRLLSPGGGATDVFVDREIRWTKVAGADRYYLYLGSEPGLKDYLDPGSTTETRYVPQALPGGRTIHARLWVQFNGLWRYVDESFETAPEARFTYPRSGAVGVPDFTQIRWSEVGEAEAYRLELGTSPGGMDILRSEELSTTEYGPISLPSSSTVYGRIWVKHGGVWRQGSGIFSTRSWEEASTLQSPIDGQLYDGRLPFTWTAQPLAASYRLTIGTMPGLGDVHDSGEIPSVRRFVSGLQAGQAYYATLYTNYLNGSVQVRSTSFIAGGGEPDFETAFQAVVLAASDVIGMAIENVPVPGSILERQVRQQGQRFSDCNDYATALLSLIEASSSGLEVRKLYISLLPGSFNFDSHTAVEVFDPDSQRWVVIDPTFGLIPVRSGDGSPATAAEVSSSSRARDWDAISYQFFDSRGPEIAAHYYLDYPLLYMNLHDLKTGKPIEEVPSVIDLYQSIGSIFPGPREYIAAHCLDEGEFARIVIDGVARDLPCEGPDKLTYVFVATSAEPREGIEQQIEFVRPSRYVF